VIDANISDIPINTNCGTCQNIDILDINGNGSQEIQLILEESSQPDICQQFDGSSVSPTPSHHS